MYIEEKRLKKFIVDSGLVSHADMTDAEVLREVMRWKALWFPKNMVEIGMKISGGDSSVLNDVPTMVGGC